MFPDAGSRAAFWTEQLGDAPAAGAKLQGLIRAKTMKQGGVGYVQPDGGSFPAMADMNRFVLEAGAIPTLAWLDGTSEGEQRDGGIVRGRASRRRRGAEHHSGPQLHAGRQGPASSRISTTSWRWRRSVDFPIIVGTEMNAPGNKFVDSFSSGRTASRWCRCSYGAHISSMPIRFCSANAAWVT